MYKSSRGTTDVKDLICVNHSHSRASTFKFECYVAGVCKPTATQPNLFSGLALNLAIACLQPARAALRKLDDRFVRSAVMQA